MFLLLKLPLLAAQEVLKYMIIRELFTFSLVSKRAKQLVSLSVPRDSICFYLSVHSESLVVSCREELLLHELRDEASDNSGPIKFPQSRNGIYHIVDTFNNPKVSLKWLNGEENILLELIQYFKMRHLDTQEVEIVHHISLETSIQILNECTDFHKLELVCPGRDSKFPPGPLNALLRRVISTDCKLEYLFVGYDASQGFAGVVEGLTNRPIQPNDSVIVQKTDGTELKIQMCYSTIVMDRKR